VIKKSEDIVFNSILFFSILQNTNWRYENWASRELTMISAMMQGCLSNWRTKANSGDKNNDTGSDV
jgi:hypothetical protein